MEKVKNKKVVVGVLITSILLVVFTLITVAFLLGREVNTADTQAAKVVATPFPTSFPGVRVEPNTGMLYKEQLTELVLKTGPGTALASGVQVKLDFQNITVNDIKLSLDDKYLVIGTCGSAGKMYTAKSVCFDVVARDGVMGEVALAKINVRSNIPQKNNNAKMRIVTNKQHGYVSNDQLVKVPSSVIATYTYGGNGNTPTPHFDGPTNTPPYLLTGTPTPTTAKYPTLAPTSTPPYLLTGTPTPTTAKYPTLAPTSTPAFNYPTVTAHP